MMFNGIAARIRIRAACLTRIWTLKFRKQRRRKRKKLSSIELVFMAPFNDYRDIYHSSPHLDGQASNTSEIS